MDKQGQGLPITTIIIAVLALLVLVVLVLIFTGRIQLFGQELVSCEGKGGFCTGDDCAFGYQTELKQTDCKGHCCLPVLPAPEGKPCKTGAHCASGNCDTGECAAA